jgi:hypothetical protein
VDALQDVRERYSWDGFILVADLSNRLAFPQGLSISYPCPLRAPLR